MEHFLGLIDADGLALLADRRESDETLHWLIASLLLKNGADLVQPPAVRTGIGMHFGGWDGHSKAVRGSLFIPQGDACWEMSKRRDVAVKAEEDYQARTAGTDAALAADTTLVIVTLRRWSKKTSWRDNKKSDGIWRDVLVYDADDLYLWLLDDPSTHAALTMRANGINPGIPIQPPRKAPVEVPKPLADFVGRGEQIKKLTGAFYKDQGGQRGFYSCVVSGLPGSGKTSLVLSLVQELQDAYPDGRFFLDLRGTQNDFLEPKTVQSAVLSAFGASAGDLEDAESVDAAYRTLLFTSRVLLVFDNARDEEQVRSLLVGGENSAVVITSRNKLLGLDVSIHLTLEGFSEDESVRLLARLCGKKNFDDATARKVANLCGNLPLAVRIAGVLAGQTPHWGLDYLASQLEDESARLNHLQAGDRGVRASFELSYRQLPDITRRCFGLCSAIPGPYWDDELAAVAVDIDLAKTRQQLRILAERNLIQFSEVPGQYKFHDLLRAYSLIVDFGPHSDNERALAEGKVWSHLREETGKHATALFDHDSGTPMSREEIVTTEQLHAIRYLDLRIANVARALQKRGNRTDDALTVQLIMRLASYFAIRPVTPDTVQIMDEGVVAALNLQRTFRIAGVKDPEMMRNASRIKATMLLFRSETISRIGDFDAAANDIEKALKIANSLGDKGLVISARTSAGQLAYRCGDNMRALAEYSAASELSEGLEDEKTRSIVGYNIGNMLRQTGDPRKSLSYLEEDVASSIRNKNALGEAEARNALGNALGALGRTAEATPHLRKAIRIYSEFADLERASDARFDLGTCLLNAGQYPESVSLLEQDAAFCRSTGNSLGAAIAEVTLVSAHAQYEPERARMEVEHLRQSLRTIRELGNPIHLARALADSTKAFIVAGRVDDGIASAFEAADIFERIGGRWQSASLLVRAASSRLDTAIEGANYEDIDAAAVSAVVMLKRAKAALEGEAPSELSHFIASYLTDCEELVDLAAERKRALPWLKGS